MRKILLFAIFAIAVFCGCEKEIENEIDEDNSLPQDPQITLTTNKEVGETIVLRFRRDKVPTEVIGAEKISEKESDADGGIFEAYVVDITYKITSQTIVLKGDIPCLRCWRNELIGLDISKCPGLGLLLCDYNQLKSLNLGNNSELGHLSCSQNQLTQLDVSKNQKLVELSCNENKLTSLDVSKNPKLEILSCANNKITSLDISENSLYYVDCSRNKIKAAEMSKIIKVLRDWTNATIWTHYDNQIFSAILSVVSNLDSEENEISEADIKIAEAKNWKF